MRKVPALLAVITMAAVGVCQEQKVPLQVPT